jgi:hypothetical protein
MDDTSAENKVESEEHVKLIVAFQRPADAPAVWIGIAE